MQIEDQVVDLPVTKYSTSRVPPARRLRYWNEINSRLFGEMHIESRSRKSFEGELDWLPLRDCELYRIRVSPMSLKRASNTSNGRPARVYALEVVVAGAGIMNISGRDYRIGEGDMVILDAEASSYFCFDEPSTVLTLVLPASGFKVRRLPLQSHLNRKIDGKDASATFLSQFLRSAWRDIEAAGRHKPDQLAESIWSLIDLAFHADMSSLPAGSGKRRQKLEDACRIVEREIRNPVFTARHLCESLGVSQRYLQMLFGDLKTTPSRYLLERRLDVAATRLRSDPGVSITDLAFEVGFNDATYFSRAFREYFQLSPREFRAARLVPDV